jgi:hypothetical protein
MERSIFKFYGTEGVTYRQMLGVSRFAGRPIYCRVKCRLWDQFNNFLQDFPRMQQFFATLIFVNL